MKREMGANTLGQLHVANGKSVSNSKRLYANYLWQMGKAFLALNGLCAAAVPRSAAAKVAKSKVKMHSTHCELEPKSNLHYATDAP